MVFLKPATQPWLASDFDYAPVDVGAIPDGVLHVLQTTALVESRADQYADYLRAVFASRGPEWIEAIDIWNHEERQHGQALRRLCEAADPDYRFEASMDTYLATTGYHRCDGASVRGSIAGELIARCVVEALASTFYRVLHDAVSDTTSRRMLQTLAQDEARHYGMFRKLLGAEMGISGPIGLWQRLRVGIGRMLELNDDQIMRAAWAVSERGRQPFQRRRIARAYAAALYPNYRLGHLRYAARMLAPVLVGSTAPLIGHCLALGLWIAVKLSALLSRR
jgi:hypothetical protein